MNKIKRVNPESLQIPTSSYSQGMVIPIGNAKLMFVTGQLAQDIEGNIVAPNDARKQTEVIFQRISDILKEGEMTLDDVVKVQIFIKDMNDKKVVSEIRNEVFKNSKPVSTLVEVTGFVKEGCCLEIEVTAVKLNQ
jgi:2-iminobutanoate/2-iminopropanoate deaminase